MRRRGLWAACVVLLLGVGVLAVGTGFANDKNDARAKCSEATLHGTYLFADHGVYATTGKPFAGAGYAYHDGNGNIHGVFSINSDGEVTRKEKFSGTYTVNADCTGRSTFPGDVEYKYDLFIDPGGDMFTRVQTKPRRSEVVSAVEQRVTLRRVGD